MVRKTPIRVDLITQGLHTAVHRWVLAVGGYDEVWVEDVHVCPDAAIVLPFDDHHIYLCSQQREGVMSHLVGEVPPGGLHTPFAFDPAAATVLAAPGGVIERHGTAFEAANLTALRELREELGLEADRPIPVGPRVWNSPGRSTERVHHFLAKVRKRTQPRPKDQHITFVARPIGEIQDLIDTAQDRGTLLLLHALALHLARHS